MIEYLLLLLSIPFGLIGAYITNYEKNIWQKYFNYLIPLSLVISIVFYFLDKTFFLTSLAILLTMLVWKYSTKCFQKIK